ncbi:MAG: site-2 protease family protein [Planctomycetaceae bacterium]|jgi:regulator of sigma E protease|nr:site-2 protease family protein [Planctomycetaceae bacterium]
MDAVLTLFAAATHPDQVTSIWSTVWTVTINILLVLLGLNVLVIVHEFGHFAVARFCGVRCEKFYIWFDFWGLKFFKFKWGDTEYGLGLFPLGGYVKMLGQEDNPGELRAEIERAQLVTQSPQKIEIETEKNTSNTQTENSNSGNSNPESSHSESSNSENSNSENSNSESSNAEHSQSADFEKLNEAVFAPDSYLAKNVPQRLAIIVAGVVMNFLFAIVCATAAYMVGIEDTAPAVGSVVSGSPAWEAGLQTGDKIVAINDSPTRVFMDINMAMVGGSNGIKLTIERENGNLQSQLPEKIEKTIIPRKRKNDLAPMIGVGSLPTLNLASTKHPVIKDLEKYYPNELLQSLKRSKLRLQTVGDIPVKNYNEYMDAQLKYFDQAVLCGFTGTGKENKVGNVNDESIEGLVPAIPMKEIGIRFKMGTIVSVLPDSDAVKKGIEPGDTILGIDGVTDFDPLKLPQMILRKVNENKNSVQLIVRKKNGQELTIDTELKPVRIIPDIGFLSMKDPVGSTALGLTWEVEPVIEAITENASETAKQLPVGGKVTAVKLLNAQPILKKNSFSITDEEGIQFQNIGDRVDIPYVFGKMLQIAEPVSLTEKQKKNNTVQKTISVRLQIEDEKGNTKTFDLPIFDSKDWFNTDRGLVLSVEKSVIKIDNFNEALTLGTKKMIECSLSVYRFLVALGNGSVSPRALGGPVAIVHLAYMFADGGLGSYLMFLCLIGANLAVINIFPMPPLDGGHVVFLLYEGIFRRPPNEMIQVVLSYFGLFLILFLMFWTLSLDLTCIPRL